MPLLVIPLLTLQMAATSRRLTGEFINDGSQLPDKTHNGPINGIVTKAKIQYSPYWA
jgi:hypothetical protein